MRIKGLTRIFSGLRATNTPGQAPLCPKRRPPQPQPPIFSDPEGRVKGGGAKRLRPPFILLCRCLPLRYF